VVKATHSAISNRATTTTRIGRSKAGGTDAALNCWVTIQFLPTDDPEARLYGADIFGYLVGYANLTNTRSLALRMRRTRLAPCGKTRSNASLERVLRIVVEVWCQASCLAGVLIKMMLTMRIQHRTRHGAVAVVPHPTAL